MHSLLRFGTLLLISGTALSAQEADGYAHMGRNYGRSMVISQQGIVSTSQALASQARHCHELLHGNSSGDGPCDEVDPRRLQDADGPDEYRNGRSQH